MKSILRILAMLNREYDKVKEPERFIMGIVFSLGPWFLMDTLSMILDHTVLKVFGILWIVSIVGLRMWYVAGNLKKHL